MSIQVNLNGLSFCILNRTSNTVEYLNSIWFGEKQTPFETLNKLKEELASNTVFSDDFDTVKVIHYNELSTLVPKPLYDATNNAEYLKFNSKILKTDFIASDEIKLKDIISIYVPYVNINNYIFETFGEFTYTHASTLFIDTVFKSELSNEDLLHINVDSGSMQVLVTKEKDIKLYNYFEFTSPEDFIYYILFTCEQELLNPDSLHLKLSGIINKDDALYKIAYKYIRNVSFMDNHNDFLIKNSF
ncbi:DUF3822 family protein [Winogradskyella sp. PC-19]|uniref:DUF3822 family protein n=1 Tax=Winogradskyella sp. PC-19 TaxID=754417 RepID=UPI0012F79B86|nr:DUF3822 family protein [Winogradskyella sp. PC-19]